MKCLVGLKQFGAAGTTTRRARDFLIKNVARYLVRQVYLLLYFEATVA